VLTRVTRLFPLWAVLLSALAFAVPHWFVPLKGAIVPLLVVIMFAMGLTLTLEDFRRVGRAPGRIGYGVLLQYAVMPLAAFGVARLLALPPELFVGMVLVGSSPGGTASNVMTYLAWGDVALSVTLTLSSTLLAVLALPALTWLYAGHVMPVPVAEMLISVLQIVALPVLAGALVNTFAGRRLKTLQPWFPLLSVAAIVVIIAIIAALNASRLHEAGLRVLFAVVLHNGIGLAAGFWLARARGYDAAVCRTLAIEVGMQNSGLAVALATQYFSAAAALPGALFSLWHNLSGSALAAWWSGRHARDAQHRLPEDR
jgi:BASS family bile acid:Na+ symporter